MARDLILLALAGPIVGPRPTTAWTRIIAVDGGGNHLFAWNMPAHLLLGDLDSIEPEAQAFHQRHWAEVQTFPRDKNETDLELALGLLPPEPASEMYLPGLLGGRSDHSFMNILILSRFTNRGCLTFPTEDGCGGVIGPGNLIIRAKTGLPAALLALSPTAHGITSTGVQWPLDNESLEHGQGRGISNRLGRETWNLTLRGGALLWLLSEVGREEIGIEWHPAAGDLP